jgi:hypothetical protein
MPSQEDVVARVLLQYRFPTGAVVPGLTFSFYVLAVSPDGVYQDVTSQSQFFSSDLTVARPAGAVYTAVGAGAAQAVAAYNGFTASMPIRVRSPGVYPFIELSGIGPNVAGGAGTFRALLVTAPSQSRVITTEATWTSSDPTVATVSAGRVETFRVGTALITATFNGLSESIHVPAGPRS